MVYKFHAQLEAGIQKNVFSYFTSTQMILVGKVKHWVVFLPHVVSSFLVATFCTQVFMRKMKTSSTGREGKV